MDDSRALLHDLPLLTFLPTDVRELVVDSFVPASFAFGNPIVREGDEADAFYVLVSGRARVIKAGQGGEEVGLARAEVPDEQQRRITHGAGRADHR